MNEAVLNLDAVLVEQNSNLGLLISELRNRKQLHKLDGTKRMSSHHTDYYSDGHTDTWHYGDSH